MKLRNDDNALIPNVSKSRHQVIGVVQKEDGQVMVFDKINKKKLSEEDLGCSSYLRWHKYLTDETIKSAVVSKILEGLKGPNNFITLLRVPMLNEAVAKNKILFPFLRKAKRPYIQEIHHIFYDSIVKKG